ncbi:hypothetical protein HDF16_002162 [Granulicella aggregans]|uniref:Uncharacterized protein n=1 Tax=Granulicella aggregans TaxID=474949 RepID=A0A7W7ZCM4_9BACT|nr:hypothetical protein [Granulicella aggregans]MBB5057456.1 hypothetical protein [Granulicella aggregans]
MKTKSLVARVIAGYEVCVILTGPPLRNWVKTYRTRDACLTDLSAIGIGTPEEIEDARKDDWDRRGGMLIFRSDIELLALTVAGFKEQLKQYVN